jgi:hypothetical protein
VFLKKYDAGRRQEQPGDDRNSEFYWTHCFASPENAAIAAAHLANTMK